MKPIQPILTVGVATLPQRAPCFTELRLRLYPQTRDRDDVELIVLMDDKKRSLGEKRNAIVQIARGEYISFVDDDDDVASDYVDAILEACKSKPDAVVFNTKQYVHGIFTLECSFGFELPLADDWEENIHTRPVMDKMAVRRELYLAVPFSDLWRGCDIEQAMNMRAYLAKRGIQPREARIDRALYRHNYEPTNMECNPPERLKHAISEGPQGLSA